MIYISLAILGFSLVLIGINVGMLLSIKQKPTPHHPQPTATVAEMTPQKLEELTRRAKQIADQNEAFQKLMGYNIQTAYGMTPRGGDTD
jgi:hypothetical protein